MKLSCFIDFLLFPCRCPCRGACKMKIILFPIVLQVTEGVYTDFYRMPSHVWVSWLRLASKHFLQTFSNSRLREKFSDTFRHWSRCLWSKYILKTRIWALHAPPPPTPEGIEPPLCQEIRSVHHRRTLSDFWILETKNHTYMFSSNQLSARKEPASLPCGSIAIHYLVVLLPLANCDSPAEYLF